MGGRGRPGKGGDTADNIRPVHGIYQLSPDGKHKINIVDKFDVDLQKMIFSVSQYGGYSIKDINGMDVRHFYGLVAMLEEKSKSERDAANRK